MRCSQADPALLRLPAPALRGTFARAYSLLAKLVSHVGWDELLKTRSTVFVMEEEYRMQKVQAELRSAGVDAVNGVRTPNAVNGVIHEDGTVGFGGPAVNGNGKGAMERKSDASADDDASTRAIVGQSIDADLSSAATPDAEKPGTPVPAHASDPGNHEEDTEASTLYTIGTDVERPSLAATKEDGDEHGQDVPAHDYSFSNKRLCERWLDNLFMVLYEVLVHVVLAPLPFIPVTDVLSDTFIGSENMDNLSRRSRPFQDTTRLVPKDGRRMGDFGRSWNPPTS
jgi:hypothetical protein